MKIETFQQLSLSGLKTLYDAEHQIVEALPKMAEAATAPDLIKAFNAHLVQSENHVKRLEQVFALMGASPERETCPVMQAIIASGKEHMQIVEKGPLLDAALISGAQMGEHYEMANYGTAHNYAKMVDQEQAASLLEQTLTEEEQADKILSGIAENTVNRQAATKQ